MTRFLPILFGLVAILGALLARGVFGEGGVQMAIGITLIAVGVLGILNIFMFKRLKASLDQMAEEQDGSSNSEE